MKEERKDRQGIILENTGLVHMVLKRFDGRGYDREELFQVGMIGLMKAVDGYNPETKYCFSTYAVPMIIGEIKRFLRDDGMVHVSRSIKENAWKIARAREQMQKTLNKEPTFEELKRITGLSNEDIILATEAMRPVEQIPEGEKAVNSLMAYGNSYMAIDNKITVEKLLMELDDQEKEIIRLRYEEEKTQAQTGQILGMTQVMVSRKEKKILDKLRGIMYNTPVKGD